MNFHEFSRWVNGVPTFSTLLGVNCLDAQELAIITYTFPLWLMVFKLELRSSWWLPRRWPEFCAGASKSLLDKMPFKPNQTEENNNTWLAFCRICSIMGKTVYNVCGGGACFMKYDLPATSAPFPNYCCSDSGDHWCLITHVQPRSGRADELKNCGVLGNVLTPTFSWETQAF